MTLGAKVIQWIEEVCFVPEGRLIGNKVVLADWQKKEILRIYDNPRGTRRAILSFGRKNGKTCLAAFLLLAHLCGPVRRINGQLFSAAQSREQAGLIFQLAAKIVRMSPVLNESLMIKDGTKELFCPEIGSRYRALSAEASTAYGLSPSFIVHDELGQVRGSRSQLYEALETATGAQVSPLSVIISTQSPSESDLLSVLIDDAMTGEDPRVICSLYTAPTDADPFADETIRMANPAMGNFLNPKEVRSMAEDARRMPSREAEYRNLILNQRVEAVDHFLAPSDWKACAGTPIDLTGKEVYCGLDLSEVADLTAIVVIGRQNNIWHVHPTFWLPGKDLAERSRRDHVPYDLWVDQGFLRLTPGASVSYEYVAQYIKRHVFDKYRVMKIGFDRWNMRHLKPWLINAGFSEKEIEEKWVEFGQGTASMSPALREFESLVLERQIAHGDNPVLNMCCSHSVVEGNDSSNRKLSKKRSSGRIDGMVALAMAIGVAPMKKTPVIDLDTLIA
jgi:phage terminase large subunit-like protein